MGAVPAVRRLLASEWPLAAGGALVVGGALRGLPGQVLPQGRGNRACGLLAALARSMLAPPTLRRCWQGRQRRRFLLLVAGVPRAR